MEIRYTSLVELVSKGQALMDDGQLLMTVDDPKRRCVGFVDNAANLHYIHQCDLMALTLSRGVLELIQTAEGRRQLLYTEKEG